MNLRSFSRAMFIGSFIFATLSCGTLTADVPTSRWRDQPQQEASQEVVVSGLSHPWGLDWLDDGSMLISERGGELYLYSPDGALVAQVAGGPDVFTGGQAGLLDVSVGPDGWVYLSYAAGTRDANRTQVSRYRLERSGSGARLTGGELVFANNLYKSGTQHFGSRLAWLPDDTLLISIGDGGNPPARLGGQFIRLQAQEPTSLFGNVVRVNGDGSIPSDNPFLGLDDYRPELYSMGHRNIQGLAVDPESGRVWATEHGSQGGDEFNLIRAGENYGWPFVTLSREYGSGARISDNTSLEGFVDPVVVWDGTVAPSGLAVDGDTIYAGGLVSRSVHVIQVDDTGAFVTERIIPVGQRVRDISIGPDRALWVLTDDGRDGRLIRMEL